MNEDFIDKYGLIKPGTNWNDSGNGVLYSVMLAIVNPNFNPNSVIRCIRWSDVVLMRTPFNTYGQESHDNYMALGVYFLITKNVFLAKELIFSSGRKLGFMRNIQKQQAKSMWDAFMWRFPQLWPIYIAAAFPLTRIPCRWFLRFINAISKVDINDASGVQLKFIQCYASKLLGDDESMKDLLLSIRQKGTTMSLIMSKYYSPEHPIVIGLKELN